VAAAGVAEGDQQPGAARRRGPPRSPGPARGDGPLAGQGPWVRPRAAGGSGQGGASGRNQFALRRRRPWPLRDSVVHPPPGASSKMLIGGLFQSGDGFGQAGLSPAASASAR